METPVSNKPLRRVAIFAAIPVSILTLALTFYAGTAFSADAAERKVQKQAIAFAEHNEVLRKHRNRSRDITLNDLEEAAKRLGIKATLESKNHIFGAGLEAARSNNCPKIVAVTVNHHRLNNGELEYAVLCDSDHRYDLNLEFFFISQAEAEKAVLLEQQGALTLTNRQATCTADDWTRDGCQTSSLMPAEGN
ncbi:hypothetical protein [Erythrobacter aureus]|uniref:Uncharacterized protein n=1 Tax=Erythrobacter aureus TaxID=2182384 RepID=A0A345YJ84_9SPHN|nr:hypothetical protein [Erythrobacter aureus]AXK43986.1 hypothetical protein DVR09_16155 [Erythrobacter aureus]